MTAPDLDLEAIEARTNAATPIEICEINRYDHGGGRVFVAGDAEHKRDLIADFYDEANREFYVAARADIAALLAALQEAERERDAWKRSYETAGRYLSESEAETRDVKTLLDAANALADEAERRLESLAVDELRAAADRVAGTNALELDHAYNAEKQLRRAAEARAEKAIDPELFAALVEQTSRADRLETEVRIVASLPVPESTEANTLGWLKARAIAALSPEEPDNGKKD